MRRCAALAILTMTLTPAIAGSSCHDGAEPKPAVTPAPASGPPTVASCGDMTADRYGAPCDLANLLFGGVTPVDACEGVATFADSAGRSAMFQCLTALSTRDRCERTKVESCFLRPFTSAATPDAQDFCARHRFMCARESSFVEACPQVAASVPAQKRDALSNCLGTLVATRCQAVGLLSCLRTVR